MQSQLILASASPRRHELLLQIGVPHRICTADIDESAQVDEEPQALVQRLALTKARHIWQQRAQAGEPALPVLGADTLGSLNGDLLIKPRDFADAQRMLRTMSGQQHDIFSAVALCHEQGERVLCNHSQVWFRKIDEAEMSAYWASGEPQDKAGAYAIQGLGAVFVERLEGSYSAVMGLPLFETAQLLQGVGLHTGLTSSTH